MNWGEACIWPRDRITILYGSHFDWPHRSLPLFGLIGEDTRKNVDYLRRAGRLV